MKWAWAVHVTLGCGIAGALIVLVSEPRAVIPGLLPAVLAAFVMGRQTAIDEMNRDD